MFSTGFFGSKKKREGSTVRSCNPQIPKGNMENRKHGYDFSNPITVGENANPHGKLPHFSVNYCALVYYTVLFRARLTRFARSARFGRNPTDPAKARHHRSRRSRRGNEDSKSIAGRAKINIQWNRGIQRGGTLVYSTVLFRARLTRFARSARFARLRGSEGTPQTPQGPDTTDLADLLNLAEGTRIQNPSPVERKLTFGGIAESSKGGAECGPQWIFWVPKRFGEAGRRFSSSSRLEKAFFEWVY